MKRVSKLLTSATMAALFVGVSTFVVIPVNAAELHKNAQEHTTATAKTTEASHESAFCKNLSGDISKVTSGITEKKNKLSEAKSAQDQKIADDNAKWDQEITANRQKWDKERQDNFAKLEAKATTDTQKAAVKAYETSVLNAVATRRSAFDAARTTFRAGVKSTIAARRSSVDSQAATFAASASAAVSTAQAACAANPANGATIRQQLVASLKTARETFQSGRKDDEKVGTTVKQLAQVRNDAFKAADATFTATTKTARETLKQAFKNTSI